MFRELPIDRSMVLQSRKVKNAVFSAVIPTSVSNPQLISYSTDVLELIGIGDYDGKDIVKVHILTQFTDSLTHSIY
jgi:hypothetical protein